MIRDISIKAVMNGFVVNCGCQNLVFNDVDTLLKELGSYLRDPIATEQRYSKEGLNARFTMQLPAVCEENRRDPAPRGVFQRVDMQLAQSECGIAATTQPSR